MPCDCKDGEFWVQTELWSPLSVELTTPSSSNGRELSRVGERLGGLMGDVVLDEGLLHGLCHNSEPFCSHILGVLALGPGLALGHHLPQLESVGNC